MAAVVGLTWAGQSVAASCPGDLDGDGRVVVSEILTVVNMVLRGCPAPPAPCPGDFNGDGVVSINEVILAVRSALLGCPQPPTGSPTPTATLQPVDTSPPPPTATDTPSPPSTPSPTASPTPPPTATATPATCPYSFTDDAANASCFYVGPFNSDPSCPANLPSAFLSSGSDGSLVVMFGSTPSLVLFATVTSPTAAALTAFSVSDISQAQPVTGSVELQQSGAVLVVAPDAPLPIGGIGAPQCTFTRYTGTFSTVVSNAPLQVAALSTTP